MRLVELVTTVHFRIIMRIGLLSDTHSYLDERVFDYFEVCDEIWHAGDIGDLTVTDRLAAFRPLRAVYGNIDDHLARRTFKETLDFTIEGVHVIMTHIGGKPGNYSLPIRDYLQSKKPALFICGHSHICKVEMDKKLGCLYMNPGAAGNHGFHHMKTLLRFTILAGKISDLEVVELGIRGR